MSYDGTRGWPVGAVPGYGLWTSAFQFTSSLSGMLDSVTVTAFHKEGATALRLNLYGDDADHVGALMRSWDFEIHGNAVSTTVTHTNLDPSITLEADSKYWIELVATDPTGYFGWNMNNQTIANLGAFTSNGGPYYYTWQNPGSVMRIDVTPGAGPSAAPVLAEGGLELVASPNPFREEMRCSVEVPTPGRVLATVVNPSGRQVRRLVDEILPAGSHTFIWNGRNDAGEPAAAGVYFVRARIAGRASVTKTILAR